MSNMVSTSTNMQSRSMELSVGVEKERVAATTLAVIQALFGERGIEFLSLILRQAVVKQLSLETLDITDVAVIQVPNLRTLASRMGWCYDAVDKYVLLFTALLLLRKQRSRHGGTELHFPLVEYRLPDQSETKLSKLYQMRPKVASLARKVVSRLAILTSPLTQKEPDSPRVAEERLLFDLDGAMADVSALLVQVLSASQQKEILPQIEQTLRYRCRLSNDDVEAPTSLQQVSSGNFLPVSEVSVLSTSYPSSQKGATSAQVVSAGVQEKLPIGRETGNFLPVSEVSVLSTSCPSSQKGATSAQVVSAGVQEKLPIGRETGNFLPASEVSVHSTSCPSSQKGATSAQGVSPQVHHKLPVENEGGNFLPASPDVAFPETGNFSSAHPEHGQLLPSTLKKLPVSGNFSDSAIVNANGNIYNNNNNTNNVSVNDITSSDRHTTKEAGVVGQRLAHFLEKSPANIGGYVNKAKQCTRTVIRAAIVDLLVHQAFPTIDPIDERGRPRHRGRWFHDACNRYSVEGLIPAYVMRWVQTDLSWQEIEQELATLAIAYQSYMVASHETAEFVRGYLRGEIDKQGLDQALQDLKMPAQSSTDGVARPIRMIEWKGRMVPEEQAYREGYYGGFERFLPGDHPDDDLLAVVERLRAEGKLILPPPRNGVHNG